VQRREKRKTWVEFGGERGVKGIGKDGRRKGRWGWNGQGVRGERSDLGKGKRETDVNGDGNLYGKVGNWSAGAGNRRNEMICVREYRGTLRKNKRRRPTLIATLGGFLVFSRIVREMEIE
jgi:hypothetical protein